MILNFQAEHSIIQVKRPKQKNDRPLILSTDNSYSYPNNNPNYSYLSQLFPAVPSQQSNFIFHSRPILNNFFKSCILKFKIKHKPLSISNLFSSPKSIESFKSPIKGNYCYYHYWNEKVKYYCDKCMQYYCCIDKCYRHEICEICEVKGCKCDGYMCGCGGMKQRQRKNYEKIVQERFYDKRELTENFKYCLKCTIEKLNTKICVYCNKSYEYYYDFETCSKCKKIYHKQCADMHASQQMSRFFSKNRNLSTLNNNYFHNVFAFNPLVTNVLILPHHQNSSCMKNQNPNQYVNQ